jgi:hypothetical protein
MTPKGKSKSVPKVAVDEDCDHSVAKDEIRLPWQFWAVALEV